MSNTATVAEHVEVDALIADMAARARAAAHAMAASDVEERNRGLRRIVEHLNASRALLLEANAADLEAARAAQLDAPLLDRLELDDARVQAMIDGLLAVVALPDPIGVVDELSERPSGIRVGRMRVPLGVVAIIYESRPNVTVDAAALCLKAGNAVILRGGSEAIRSNRAIAQCIADGLVAAGLPIDAAQLVPVTDRGAVSALIGTPGLVDMLVPRGGKSLVSKLDAEAKVPMLKHLDGVCHVYIDDEADARMALDIAINAKTHRYGVCNAAETLLVARARAAELLPELAERYRDKGVELRGCAETCRLIADARAATEDDWNEEYLAPILAVRVVDGLAEAIRHINEHGSHHTDAIVTENQSRAQRFLREVDSASVMHNASTRFADGFEYGLGAEIGISTDKLHARGPVGLEGLTTRKFVVLGNGQVRT